MRTDLDEDKDLIIESLLGGSPQASIARSYCCKITTLKKRLAEWNVDHLKNQSRKGICHTERQKPLCYYLVDNCPTKITSHALRLKLIETKTKQHVCEVCGLKEWNGSLIPIELDHIDGVKTNNKIENLRILCPNCHAQTDTYKTKNRKKKTKKRQGNGSVSQTG